ncbi:MAG: FG-GAP repeat domain-containing protein [Pyrinomonadaceae bacterium]
MSADGRFVFDGNYGTGPYPKRAAVADVNEDGRLDLLVGNFGGGSISILLNSSEKASIYTRRP